MTDAADPSGAAAREGHGGDLAVAVARARTASRRCSRCPAPTSSRCTTPRSRPSPAMRLVDVRHEQTAVFAAEATGKLTRTPGLAVLTAGPGRDQRRQRGRAGVVQRLAAGRGRRPGADAALGHGQPAGARPPADPRAGHEAGAHDHDVGDDRRPASTRRSRLAGVAAPRAGVPRRADGPAVQPGAESTTPRVRPREPVEPDPDAIARSPRCSPAPTARCWCSARTSGSDGAEEAALRLVEETRPAGDHQRHGPRRRPRRPPAARHQGALGWRSGSATWRSWSARRWTSGSATGRSAARTGTAGAGRAPAPTRPGQVSGHADAGRVGGRRPRRLLLDGIREAVHGAATKPDWSAWTQRLPDRGRGARPSATPSCSAADADPIHPARIYGELRRRGSPTTPW